MDYFVAEERVLVRVFEGGLWWLVRLRLVAFGGILSGWEVSLKLRKFLSFGEYCCR